MTQTAHSLSKAMLSHREGGRIVAGSTFCSKAMVKLKITSTRVLYDAGFDLLHASLASDTVLNYVWGYVIEEQTAPLEPGFDLSQAEPFVSRFKDCPEWKLVEELMDEREKLTGKEQFDRGLQVIMNGLRMSLDDEPLPAKN